MSLSEAEKDKAIEACEDTLAETRAYLRYRAPYIMSLVYGLIPHYAWGIGTLGVTKGMVLYIDPVWFVSLPVEQRGAVIMHECGHIIRGMQRLERLSDPNLANIAGDIPNNDDLKAAVWQLPEWAIYSSTYGFPAGLPLEQYYELLQKKQQQMQGQPGPGKGSDKGDKKKDGKGQPGEASGAPGQGKVTAGKCGSCAGNGDSELEIEIDKIYGRSEADKQRIIKKAAAEIQEAISKGGKQAGTMPGMFKELLEFTKETKAIIDWRSRLAHMIRKATGRIVSGRTDYSLKRPSKRSMSRLIPRPGLITRAPIVAMVEDTSGSMDSEQLKAGRVEACGIFQQLGLDQAWWISADAQVAGIKQVRLKDIKRYPVLGRGGTDFRPAIEAAAKLKPFPNILVYFTDGYGPAPAAPPKGMTVIWCLVPGGMSMRPAPWGELVVISNDPQYSKAA